MGKLWRIDGQSPNLPMFSPANVLRYTVYNTQNILKNKKPPSWLSARQIKTVGYKPILGYSQSL